MLLIDHTSVDPYFNLALEEYLLKHTNEDIFLLYVDNPSVIVGKHQNTLAEVNIRYATENNIQVVRRISGGGTVYHDQGNLNFCFIANGKEGHLVDFKKFTTPILEVLYKLGLEVKLEGKNDLRIEGLKISGNAEHVFKKRVLHHGTLLVSTDLQNLSSILKVEAGKYTDNAVKSIRSKVSNINSFLIHPISVVELKSRIFEHISTIFQTQFYHLSPNDIAETEKLVVTKFSTWEWNFAYSPRYEFRNKALIENTETTIYLEVENGIISQVYTDEKLLNSEFIGMVHEPYRIEKHLMNKGLNSGLKWSFF